VLALPLCLTTLLESDGYPVTYAADKGPFAGTLKPLFKVGDLLVKVEVERRRSRFDLEEPDWSGTIGTAHYVEALRLSSGEVPGNALDLCGSGVVPHSGTTHHFCVYLPGAEQAAPPRGRSESSEGKLLGGELPLYGIEVTLPLEK
jgi:hypothetical protein